MTIVCPDAEFKAGLSQAFRQMQGDITLADAGADICLYAFDPALITSHDPLDQAAGARKRKPLQIFLESLDGVEGSGAEQQAVILGVLKRQVVYVRTSPILRRHGISAEREQFSAMHGYAILADAIRDIIAGRSARVRSGKSSTEPADVVAIRTLMDTPSEFLPLMRWEVAQPPRVFGIKLVKDEVEDFLNRRIKFPGGHAIDFEAAPDWGTVTPKGVPQSRLFALEFLGSVLSFWFFKAYGRGNGLLAEIEEVVKEKSVSASELLDRAGAVAVDFIVNNRPEFSQLAWRQEGVSSRLGILLSYALSAMFAAKRKIKFDEARCAEILKGAVDHIEILRSDILYRANSVEGVGVDCLLIVAGIILRKTPYGQNLQRDSLERLERLQLLTGLSLDGVWRGGSLEAHSSVLAALTDLIGISKLARGMSSETVTTSAKKMTVFLEAMLKSDGRAIAIDGSRPGSHLRTLDGARRHVLSTSAPARANGEKGSIPSRLIDTYVFRDAQYFVSHSADLSAGSSQLALHAADGTARHDDPGGMFIAFAHGPTDLLVRGANATQDGRNTPAARYDAALRNGYRVDGIGYAPDPGRDGPTARIVKSWRGNNWAAAKCIDETNSTATVSRVAIHLKSLHALIVVDGLDSKISGPRVFEQVWNLSGKLESPATADLPLLFTTDGNGVFEVAFDGQRKGHHQVEPLKSGPRIRRSESMSRGIMASMFRWGGGNISIGVDKDEIDDWLIRVSGNGFQISFELAGNELRQLHSEIDVAPAVIE